MLGEACGIDGRRGDDDLQLRPLFRQPLQIAQQKVDIQAALVRLVDDDGVVGAEPWVALRLGEQDAVGHELDQAAFGHLIVEAHLEADDLTDRRTQFLRHAARYRSRCQAARLSTTDHACLATTSGQAQLGQLGGLARAGFTGDHHDLMFADQLDDVLGARADRQRLVQPDRRLGRHARAPSCRGSFNIDRQHGQPALIEAT